MMSGIHIFSSHLQKLGHPIKEIRERALNQLLAKLKYGFKFDDELTRTKELLQVIFQWFSYDKPTFQTEVLSLMLFALKSDAGNTLIRDIGVGDIMRNLDGIKEKVNADSEELFNKILDTVQFSSIRQSTECENIPKLDIPQSACSSNDPVLRQSGNMTMTVGDIDANDTLGFEDRNNYMRNCIRVLLLPWIQPCKSDLKTLSLIEDTLQIVKSTKKCCRFLKDVLIKDFPPDIFFNRPLIIKKLQTMVGVQGIIVDILEVLLSITIRTNNRIDQLLDVSICNSKLKVHIGEKSVQNADVEDAERIVSGISKPNCAINLNCLEDNIAPLNQLPVPYFCLDTMYEVVLSLGRNVIIISSGDNEDAFGMEEINVAFSLLNALTMLLFKCVHKAVWVVDHNKKILKDIVQKSFMVMREGGELLNKYSTSFLADNNKVHHRLAYMRLIPICLDLMKWAECTPLLPNSLCTGLQNALSDVVLSYTHPFICSELAATFQSIKSMVNKDYSKKYTEMLKTCQGIQSASLLIKTPDKYKDNVDVIDIIKKSLSVLELHNSHSYVKFIMKIFILKLHTWSLEEEKIFLVRKILLSLLASHVQWVQIEVYRTISASVINVLTNGSKSDLNGLNEESLQFLMDSNIMTEILCHGLSSNTPAVKTHASDIIVYLIRGKLMLSEKIWMLFLQSFLPVLPLLHAYAAHDDILGNAIIKSLDLNIAECMQLPKKEIINGNIRLLFVKCYTAQMEGAHNLCAILNMDDSDTQLPPASAIRPDLLITIVRRVKPMKFNTYTRSEEEQEQRHDVGLIQVLDLLKNGLRLDESYVESVTDLNDISNVIEPAFRRSTLQQLAVMMQQPSLHNSFLEFKGIQLVYVHLRLSLLGEDFAVFAECSKSCISILNSVLSTSGVARQTMLKKCGICLLILRAMLHFPNDDSLVMLATQTLFLLVFSSYLLQDLSSDRGLSLPQCIVSGTNIPFHCSAYWKTSNYKTHSLLDLISEDDVYKSFLRFNWSVSWYGSIDSIAKWPFVPEKDENEDFASFLHVTDKDLTVLKLTHPLEGTKMALYKVQNSTTHKSVDWSLSLLTGYALVTSKGTSNLDDYYSFPWFQTFSRYIGSTPASPKDVLLLIRVLKFMLVYVECALQHDTNSSGEAVNWIISALTENNFTVFSVLLKTNLYPEQNASDYNDITLLQCYIVKVLLHCVVYCDCYSKGKIQQNSDRWLSVLNTFLTCLNVLDLTNFEILGYLGETVKCIRYLVQSELLDLPKETVLSAVKVLIKVAHTCPQGENNYDGFKGQDVLFNLLIALSGFLQGMHRMDLTMENWTNTWFENKEKTLLMLFACCKCDRVDLRTAAFHLIVGLTNNPMNIFHLDETISAVDDGVLEFSTKVLIDVTEASIVRVQATRILLNIIMARNSEDNMIHHKEIMEHFSQMEVSNIVLSTLVEYCSEVNAANIYIGTNISFDHLENKEKWENSKRDEFISRVKVGYRAKPQITMEFVAALANLVYGVICHESEELINKWNKEGLFRMFFRCLYCQDRQKKSSMTLFSAVCRLLSQASFVSQEVFGTLVETQDCVTALLQILVNLDLDIHNLKTIQFRDAMWKYAFELIGVLISNENGLIVVWRMLYEDDKILCFFQTLLFCLNSKSSDLRKTVYFCLSNLLNGFITGLNISGDELIMFLNNTEVFASTACLEKKEPPLNQDKCGPKQICLIADVNNVEYNGEDLCETQCLAEDLCKCLIERYNVIYVTQNEFKGRRNNEYLDALVSCLSALFSLSEKARFYAIHVGFTLHLLNSLHMIRNLLTIDGKPVEVLKSIQRNPSLLDLERLLLLMINLMRDCSDAKDCLAENNVCVSLNKLWPWFMVTKSLRNNIIHFLDTFTNGCAKAWAAMHNCVGLHCLLYEIVALLSKEMSTLTQAKQTYVIKGCLKILENCCAQVHCRTLLLKSEVLNYVQKLHPAISKRRPVWKQIEKPWEQFLLEVTTYSEGQMKLMEHSAVMCALIHQADGLMLRVLTNCAFCSINRVKFTSSGEILHLFSVKLSMEGNLDDKVAICGAIWALAANNHKAKLLLRNAGITADLRDCITSMKNMGPMDHLASHACELMTYVHKVLTIS